MAYRYRGTQSGCGGDDQQPALQPPTPGMIHELRQAFDVFELFETIGSVVLTGGVPATDVAVASRPA